MNTGIFLSFLDFSGYIALVIVSIIDMKRGIISERGFLILLTIGLIRGRINGNMERVLIGMSIYPLPFIFLYTASDYFKKELIGFGDIKLMMAIGSLIGYEGLERIWIFYQRLYILSGIIICLPFLYFKMNKIRWDYIPFGPFIAAGYIMEKFLQGST